MHEFLYGRDEVDPIEVATVLCEEYNNLEIYVFDGVIQLYVVHTDPLTSQKKVIAEWVAEDTFYDPSYWEKR